MAGPSISNIAVNVGMNAAGLQKGAQQAAQAVNSFTAQTRSGLGNVSSVAQQATFAVDDFMAAFQTGGIAGGIRGASNNLTTIASSIGGIKVQLAAIAALSVTQLAVKWWDDAERKRIEASRKAIDDWRNSIQDARDAIARGGSNAAELREIARSTDRRGLQQRLGDLSAEGRAGFGQGAELLALRNRLDTELQNLRFTSGRTDEQNERIQAIEQEIQATDKLMASLGREDTARIKTVRAIEDQIKSIEAAEEAQQRVVDSQFQFKPFVTEGDRAAMRAKQDEIAAIDEEIASIRGRGAMSMAEMFTRFAGANTMGSIGAISTIHSSQFGPQNSQAAGVQAQRDTARDTRRIRELMEKRQALEVVPL